MPIPAGANATLAAHLDAQGDPTLTAFVNDTSEVPAGQARLTVRHVAAAPAVETAKGEEKDKDKKAEAKPAPRVSIVADGFDARTVALPGTKPGGYRGPQFGYGVAQVTANTTAGHGMSVPGTVLNPNSMKLFCTVRKMRINR